MNISWNTEQIEFLKKHYPSKGSAFIASKIGKTKASVKTKAVKMGIRSNSKRKLTNGEKFYIKMTYPNISTKKIAAHLNLKITTVYNFAYKQGLKKTTEFLASPESGIFIKGSTTGREYRFDKGHVPINKGKKQIEYMNKEAIERTKETRFKIGHKPQNTLYNGCISIRTHKRSKLKYKYIRLKEGNWELLHRVLWKEKYGDIPEGYNIIFKDGNQLNVAINNLKLVSNAELMELNTIHRYPEELKTTFRAIGKLNKTIKVYEEQNK